MSGQKFKYIKNEKRYIKNEKVFSRHSSRKTSTFLKGESLIFINCMYYFELEVYSVPSQTSVMTHSCHKEILVMRKFDENLKETKLKQTKINLIKKKLSPLNQNCHSIFFFFFKSFFFFYLKIAKNA